MKWLLFLVMAYLIGSIPCGVMVARLTGREDPRGLGSGNIGATNVARTLGRKAGAATLAGDVLKGAVPVLWATDAFHSPWAVAGVGLAAYLGHLYPLYLGFRGGKGIATGLGIFLAIAPGSVFFAALLFGLLAWRVRIVSVASVSASAALPLLLAFFAAPFAHVALGLAVAGLSIGKHQPNIQRLLDGTESRMDGRAGRSSQESPVNGPSPGSTP